MFRTIDILIIKYFKDKLQNTLKTSFVLLLWVNINFVLTIINELENEIFANQFILSITYLSKWKTTFPWVLISKAGEGILKILIIEKMVLRKGFLGFIFGKSTSKPI